MNIRHCCQIEMRAGGNAHRPASSWRRGGEVAGWIVPSFTLVLLPKCPMCVAVYLALATGIDISLPAATYLRVMLLVLCVAALIFITTRWLSRLTARRARQNGHSSQQ